LTFNFVLYVCVILAYPLFAARKGGAVALTQTDIIILAVNTLFNCAMMYSVLNRRGDFDYNGLLAVGFFAVYYAGARLVERMLADDRRVSGLFYITALTFAILVIPLQFGQDWLMLGWLAEGTGLFVYGALRREKWFERAGCVVTALAGFVTLLRLSEILYGYSPHEGHLTFINYTCMALGLVCIAAAELYAHRADALFAHTRKGKTVLFFKNAAVVHTLLYCLYAAAYINDWVYDALDVRADSGMLLITVMMLYGVAVKYIRPLADRAVQIIALCINILAVLLALSLNMTYAEAPAPASTATLVLFNILSVFVVFDTVSLLRGLFVKARAASVLSLVASVYAWLLLSVTLVTHFSYNVNSIIISAVAMTASLLWIIFGFARRNRVMRVFGLVFSLFSLAKLFFMDLYFLQTEARIVSYFVFGLIFLAISFVYQHFSRKLAAGTEVSSDGE
jgi:hypothetical protein